MISILTKTFLAIYFIFISNLSTSQISVFSNTVATACSADFGTVYGATFSRTVSATGLPAGGLSAAGIVLREVRVKLGNSGCTGSLSTYSLQIKNPQGVVVTLANNLMTTGVSSWVNMKFRDDVSLERIKEYPAAVQWGYVPHSIGYYALETDGQFANLFTGLNPNGTWTFEMIEGTTSEVSFERVEFVFGPDLGVSDVTTCSNNNFCSGASCISNGVYRGNNNGYSQPDAQMPSLTVGGCNWNGANNNSAWFKFQPTSTTAKVTVSGMLNSAAPGASDMQPIVLRGNGACITPTLVPTGGCPDDQVTNNTDYITTNGGGSTAANVYVNGISENCEFNLSGLTIGADYYLYVDGNGGVSSFFYIEVENGVNSVCSSCCNITIGGGQSTMCVGDASTTFTQSGGVAGGTWSVVPSSAGTINSSGVFTPTTSAASSINATISYNDGTCSSTRALTINPIPTASISTPSTLSCIATTITLTGSGGGAYNWSGPGIVSGGATATPSVNLPGTYNLTLTTGGCSASTSVSISQNTITPTLTMPGTQTLTCAAPTATLIASANPSTCTVVWAGGVTSGVNSYTATTSSATIYTLTVTNPNNGCTNSGTVQVSPSAGFPSVTSNMTNSITCSTTTAQVVASTTTSPVSYSWTGPGTITGANSATATVNAGGTYTCVVTNTSSACSSTTTIFVPTNTTVPTITATNASTLTCTTLTANLTGTGGGSYNWSGPGITGGGATATPTVNLPGTYNLTVTAANGCTATANTAITQNTTIPTASASNTSTLTCSTTTVQLTGTGGGTYLWSGPGITAGGATATPTVNLPGTYNLTVTAANGCTATASTAITQNTTSPIITATNASTLTCATTSAQLIGTGGGNYSWDGPSIIGGQTTATPTVNLPGTYNLTVTAANGCTATASTAITQNTTSPIITATNASTLTCATSTAQLAGTGGGTYSWSGPGITAGGTTATPTVNLPGAYNLTVTAANGCTATASTAITQNTTAPTITATNASTLTCTTLTANLTGTGGGTYSWSGTGITSGATTATATVNQPGTYTLLVTAANGCTATANTTITQNTTAPTANASNSTTLTCATTTANVTGTGGGNYSWSGPGIVSGGATSSPVVNQGGTYVVTVTATNGCTATANTTITQNTTAPTASASNTSTLNCTTLTANLTGTGGGSYNWSGPGITAGGATATPTVNLPGTYNLTVTAANGCTATANTTITQNTITPSVSTATSGVLNCTLTSVNASATTTTSPVNYNWTGLGITAGGTTSTPTINAGGTYNYTVTNTTNGCQTTGSVAVSQNTTVPSASATGGTLTCANTSTILVGGPASGVTYSWSGAGLSGATNLANATATTAGSYTLVTTSTTNGCTNTAVATVTNNTVTPTANAGSTQTLVCGVSSVTLTGAGTPLGSTANWLGGVVSPTSFTTTVGAPGTYTLVVTHPTSGCTSTSTVAVSSSTDVPQATVNAITNSITCTNSVVAIGVTLSNTDPVSYTWTGPGIAGTNNTASTTATVAGTYSVTITNTVSNCQSVFNVVVPTNTNNPVTTASSSNTITCSTTSITVSATPTGTNYGYAWSGPGTITNGTTANPGVNVGGTYTVTITDNINGCIGTGTVNVATNTVSPTMTLTPSSLTTTCANPTATLLATSSADPDVNYVWTAPSTGSLNNTTINNPVANGSGVFTVQVTNTVSGCVSA
ncbi:MAG: beta strand repeat-containing protein, partial [Dolichospermum sp.]